MSIVPKKKKQREIVTYVSCTSVYCPLIQEDKDDPVRSNRLNIKVSEACKDKRGNYWCMRCKIRCDLMNWGTEHGYPDVQCPPYAVAPGYECWFTAIGLGTDAFMYALAMVLGLIEEEAL